MRPWIVFWVVLLCGSSALAQTMAVPTQPQEAPQTAGLIRTMLDVEAAPPHLRMLLDMGLGLPVAGLLGAALALRPRRKGTPPRSPAVIHTQIILAIIGAVVMLVVGSNLARAFGIAGAASLIRYRAKIDDPKDAGVMLSTLAVGLATGVGLYVLAACATVFILVTLWLVESWGAEPPRPFQLKLSGQGSLTDRAAVEAALARHGLTFELRALSDAALGYEVQLPAGTAIDAVSQSLRETASVQAVAWSRKEPGKDKDGE